MPHWLRGKIAIPLGIVILFVLWSFRDRVIYEKPAHEVPFWWRWFRPDRVAVIKTKDAYDERANDLKAEVTVQSSRRL